MEKEIYGIDLGTTYSCIAVVNDRNQPEVIPIENNSHTVPSIVHYGEKGTTVGTSAKNRMQSRPNEVVVAIKRKMGSKSTLEINGKTYTPSDVSSEILKHLVTKANEYRRGLGQSEIFDAVVAIPANYEEEHKQAVLDAGKLAGLNILKLVTEPTAAALSYKNKATSGSKTIMVYDLGGGTFDISVLKVENNKFTVIATDGEHELGGLDWDKKILEAAFEIGNVTLTDDYLSSPKAYDALDAAERAKRDLSSGEETDLNFTYNNRVYPILDYTKRDFEQRTQVLVNKSILKMIEVAKEAKKKDYNIISDDGKTLLIDELLLVGGSSNMPMIKKAIANRFSGLEGEKLKLADPNEAIAKGAAIAAKIELVEQKIKNGEQLTNSEQELPSFKDVISCSYGVKTKDGKVFNIIMMNENYPITKRKHQFITSAENQSSVQLSLYSNKESDQKVELAFSKLIKTAKLEWGYPVAKGTNVDVFVSIDKNGMVVINATAENKEVVVAEFKL